MRRSPGKIWLSVWSPGNVRYLQAGRVAWLAALLVAASLAEGSLADVAGGGGAARRRQHVFRLGRSQLAPTPAG
jgi:hypothetical protein